MCTWIWLKWIYQKNHGNDQVELNTTSLGPYPSILMHATVRDERMKGSSFRVGNSIVVAMQMGMAQKPNLLVKFKKVFFQWEWLALTITWNKKDKHVIYSGSDETSRVRVKLFEYWGGRSVRCLNMLILEHEMPIEFLKICFCNNL